MRRVLDDWFKKNDLRPQIRLEFDDMALLKVFGEATAAVFPVPTTIEEAALAQTATEVLGRTNEISVSFYLISLNRQINNPVLAEMLKNAEG